MREHQIVINLKREQFEEVQRLARLSGSKSVAAYLRERVLEHLASQNEDASGDQAAAPATRELLEINHELTRMHRELQVFIAESLSTNAYNSDEDEDDLDDEIYYAYRNFQQETELDEAREQDYDQDQDSAQDVDTEYSAPNDPYSIFQEPVAQPNYYPPPFTLHRTTSAYATSYSPPAEEPQPATPTSGKDRASYVEPEEDDQSVLAPGRYQKIVPPAFTPNAGPKEVAPEHSAQPAGLNNPSTKQNPEPQGQKATPVQHHSPVHLPDAITPGAWSGISTTEAGIYSSSTAESIWLTPPNQVLKPGYQNDGGKTEGSEEPSQNAYSSDPPVGSGLQQTTTQKNTNSTIPVSGQAIKPGTTEGGKPEVIGAAHDELEDLAERAFAISPRLGAIDKLSNAPVGFRKRQLDDPLDDLIDDKIMEEAEKLRQASIEEASPYDNSVVYAFDTAENDQATTISAAENDSDQTVSFPQSEETQSLTNNLALQLEQESRPDISNIQNQGSDPDLSYAISQDTQSSKTLTAADLAAKQEINDEQIDAGDPDSAPPPPAPSMDDPPPPPAPRPDYGSVSGPPPKRRQLPEDQSPDDDERISGGPPPKRRKR